nr:uncharacterized protein CI109_003875 [Kwoniella shandongensis]KAA5527903.1 hypothetical protein CI109_003875 [Kwoniella shandongensis]
MIDRKSHEAAVQRQNEFFKEHGSLNNLTPSQALSYLHTCQTHTQQEEECLTGSKMQYLRSLATGHSQSAGGRKDFVDQFKGYVGSEKYSRLTSSLIQSGHPHCGAAGVTSVDPRTSAHSPLLKVATCQGFRQYKLQDCMDIETEADLDTDTNTEISGGQERSKIGIGETLCTFPIHRFENGEIDGVVVRRKVGDNLPEILHYCSVAHAIDDEESARIGAQNNITIEVSPRLTRDDTNTCFQDPLSMTDQLGKVLGHSSHAHDRLIATHNDDDMTEMDVDSGSSSPLSSAPSDDSTDVPLEWTAEERKAKRSAENKKDMNSSDNHRGCPSQHSTGEESSSEWQPSTSSSGRGTIRVSVNSPSENDDSSPSPSVGGTITPPLVSPDLQADFSQLRPQTPSLRMSQSPTPIPTSVFERRLATPKPGYLGQDGEMDRLSWTSRSTRSCSGQ